jgi:predicted NBD/HSP70 family sugar kinase
MNALPAHLRRVNQRLVLNHLLRHPLASRAQLAAALHMSQPTAGKVIADLLDSRVIEEVDSPDAAAGPGRPGRMLGIDTRTPRFVLVQVGVRHTRLVAAPLMAATDDSWSVCFRTPKAVEPLLQMIAGRRAGLALPRPWGVLVSVPGVVDEPAGNVVFSPNLHGSEGDRLARGLRELWDAPVCLVQEIRALALGHMLATAADDFLLTDFGDGVGGAAVIGGRLYDSPLPLSAEMGHSPVPGNRRRCGCGGRGCLETLVGRRGLLHTFAVHHRLTRPRWSQLVEHMPQRALPRWLIASLRHAGGHVAASLNVLGLRRVVITGCLAELGEPACEVLASAVRQGAMWQRFGELAVEFAPRRRAAGLIAAGIDRIVSPVPAWRSASAWRSEGVGVPGASGGES